MELLIRRFFSSTFKSVRPRINFKYKHPTKIEGKERLITNKGAIKEAPLEVEVQKTDETLLNKDLKDKTKKNDKSQVNDFISSDLLTFSNTKKQKYNIKIDNKTTELLYGIHPILLALKSNRRSFYNVYIKESSLKNNMKLQEINELCKEILIPTNYINKNRFIQLLGPEKLHQGVCMETSKLPFINFENYSEEEKLSVFENSSDKCQIWLYLDQINDPMNFGAILRTAYYFGIDKVLTSAKDSCPITSTVSKASSGVAEILPVYQILNIEEFLQNIHNFGWQIVSSMHSGEALPLEKFQGSEKMLLIVGNEGRGVSPVIERFCDVSITIPPASNCVEDTHSLNVSAATSVMLHFLSSKFKRIS